MIRLENVTKIYKSIKGKIVALDNVSLEFSNKGLVFICGKNGHGKSTLLNCISLLDESYGGNIFINDKSYKELSEKDKIKLKRNTFGYIFQQRNLIDELTCEENINISSRIFKENKLQEIEIASQLPLSHYPKQMSGGQEQKATIYRALRENKKILICDEPTAALDYKNTISFFEELKKIAKEKLVICVAHNMDLIEKYADRIIKIENGRVIQDDVINQTDRLENVNFSDDSKISYFNLFKFGLSFFKNKAFLSTIYLALSILLLFIIIVLTAFPFNNGKAQISKLIEEYDYPLELCYDQTTTYKDGTEFNIKSKVSNGMLSSCEKYLNDNYIVSWKDIKFIKNSGIKIKEAYIGEKDFVSTYKCDFTEPFVVIIKNAGFSLELKIIGTFQGTGYICDYDSFSLIKNDYQLTVKGGVWLDAKIDDKQYDISDVLERSIGYESVSSLNKRTGNSYVLKGNEVILTDFLKSFDEENPTKKFFSFADFSNSDALYNYIDMSKIFPNGIKPIEETIEGYYNIVVSDEKYEELLSEYNLIENIYLYNPNPDKTAKMILDNDYYFNDNNTYDTYYKINYSHLDLSFSIFYFLSMKNSMVGFLIAIGVCILVLALISIIFISLIYKNEAIKIGIFRCMGLSKAQSVISVFCTFVVFSIVSILFSSLLFVIFDKGINFLFEKVLNHNLYFIGFNSSSILICLINFVIISALFIIYTLIMLRKKQIKDYFSAD